MSHATFFAFFCIPACNHHLSVNLCALLWLFSVCFTVIKIFENEIRLVTAPCFYCFYKKENNPTFNNFLYANIKVLQFRYNSFVLLKK